MILSTQYYRPPFPEHRHWREDMRAIREAGMHAVYLWACWGWIEPEPGNFRFDDYDQLIAAAAAENLQVVINTIGEIQPFWIHREIPDSMMIDHRGTRVASSLRVECNVGLTPGGCTDNAAVRDLMGRFLVETATRYGSADNVIAWDLWNETRWARQAGGYVCFCKHTLSAFRSWLESTHGSLEGLCEAWKRRYSSWEDVYPASVPGRPYTDQMEFMRFLSWRAAEHMQFRHDRVRAHVPAHHLIVAHGANTASLNVAIDEHEQALSRGVDGDFMATLDGFGASMFPTWFNLTNVDFGSRAEASRSAAGSKIFWVGELQGGSARGAMEVRDPVPGAVQQRWVWNLIGRGAKAINFWCWRDEVFARESSGFGIIGSDGHARDRIAAMRVSTELVKQLGASLDEYRPDSAAIGVVFDRSVYYLDWAQHGNTALHATPSLHSYLKALEQAQAPYDVLEPGRHGHLTDYRLVFMPFPLIVDTEFGSTLVEWVRAGGTLVVESEVDAYDQFGFYRPHDERPFANALGVSSLGRRTIIPAKAEPDWVPSFLETTQPAVDPEGVACQIDSWRGKLRTALWYEALSDHGVEVLGANQDGAMLIRIVHGAGQVYALGAFPGLAHSRMRSAAFESFVAHLVDASKAGSELHCNVRDGEALQWRSGRSKGDRFLFIVNNSDARTAVFTAAPGMLPASGAASELTGRTSFTCEDAGLERKLEVQLPAADYALLRWPV